MPIPLHAAPVVCFSMEVALESHIPTYAGDPHLRKLADFNVGGMARR